MYIALRSSLRIGLALLLLSSCQSLPGADKSSDPLPTGYDIGELPGQRLAPGQCGLFLFTPLPRARFVFFAEWEKSKALIRLDGKDVALSGPVPIEEDNDMHPVRRGFASADERIRIEIAVTPFSETLTDGVRIRSGLIRIRSQGGWLQLVPVAGAFACAPN